MVCEILILDGSAFMKCEKRLNINTLVITHKKYYTSVKYYTISINFVLFTKNRKSINTN